MEACIKHIKFGCQKCFYNNNDVNFVLLQIGFTPLGTGLPSLAILLYKWLIRALQHQVNSKPINYNAHDENYKALKLCQDKCLKNNDTEVQFFSHRVYSMHTKRWWLGTEAWHDCWEQQHRQQWMIIQCSVITCNKSHIWKMLIKTTICKAAGWWKHRASNRYNYKYRPKKARQDIQPMYNMHLNEYKPK